MSGPWLMSPSGCSCIRCPAGWAVILIAVRYISAAAAARIGGDLYDVVAAQGTTRLIVADVQGKGLAAVQTAAVVLAAFRESAYDAADLVTIADHIERSLEHQAPGDRFVTAIMAELATGRHGDTAAELRAPGAVAGQPRAGRAGRAARGALPLGLGHLDGRPTGRSTPSRSARATACFSTPTASARPATAPAPFTSPSARVRAHCWPDRIRTPRLTCSTTTCCAMSAATSTMTRPPCSLCARGHDRMAARQPSVLLAHRRAGLTRTAGRARRPCPDAAMSAHFG